MAPERLSHKASGLGVCGLDIQHRKCKRLRSTIPGTLLILLGCLAGCQQFRSAASSTLESDDRRQLAMQLILSDRRWHGTLANVALEMSRRFILTVEDPTGVSQVCESVDLGHFAAEELLRVRKLRGSVVLAGVDWYKSALHSNWVLRTTGSGHCIRGISEIRDLFTLIEDTEGRSDWQADACAWERGLWDTYLHNHDKETEDHDRLMDLLATTDRTMLRRDIIGWLSRTMGQPDETWVYSWVGIDEYGDDVESVRDLAVLVLESLMGLEQGSLAHRPLGHFELTRRLWILETTLASILPVTSSASVPQPTSGLFRSGRDAVRHGSITK